MTSFTHSRWPLFAIALFSTVMIVHADLHAQCPGGNRQECDTICQNAFNWCQTNVTNTYNQCKSNADN